MLVFDLKTIIFILLFGVCAAIVLMWYLARRESLDKDASSTAQDLGSVALLEVLAEAPFGLLLLGHGAAYRYANGYAQRLLHLTSEAGALPDTAWGALLDEDRAASRQLPNVGRYRNVTFASGHTARWWVMVWETGELVYLLDITAQQRTEQSGRALLNDMAHELRTPIAAILTHLEILGLSDVHPDLQQQSLNLSRDEAQRKARLINDMLALGRLEASPLLELRPLDLLALVEDVVFQATPRAAERQMALSFEADSPLPLVSGNEDRLRQVFLNALDNAFKYARPGDQVRVILSRVQDSVGGDGVTCAICDTGPGVTAEHLPYITRRFYRATPKSIEGSGLGLALAAEILRRHNSHLDFESRTGENSGTCVRFALFPTELRPAP